MNAPLRIGVLGDPGIVIPPGTSFTALKLNRLATGVVSLDYDALMQVWVASGLPWDLLHKAGALDILSFVARWYAEHMHCGGGSDPMHAELVAYLLGRKTSLHQITFV